jgi:hypothetical protein
VKPSLEQVLDTCLTELNIGADLEVVLAAHPEHADELRPMLAAAALVRLDVPPPVRKAARKEAFLEAVASRRREVETTEGYIVELKAGVPFADLLQRATPEMRPLIHAAWRMYTTAPPEPSVEKVADGKRLLMAMAVKRRAERRAAVPGVGDRMRSTLDELVHGLRPQPSAVRRAWSGAVAALLMFIVISVGVAGVGSAAASSLPGDSFYGVKQLGRSAQLLFAFDLERRAELNIRFSGQRLDEIQALTSEGRFVPIYALQAWLEGQQNALASIQQLPLDQRQFLVEMLLAMTGEPESLDEELRGSLADPTVLDDILRSSGDLLDRARAAAGATPETAEQRTDGERASGELPPEKTVSRQARPRPKSEPPEEPAVVSPPAEPAAELPAPPESAADDRQFVQPAGEDSSSSPSRDRDEPASDPGGADEPGDEPAPAATAPSPPAFSQPIFEDPTETPEPVEPEDAPADPGGAPDPPPDEPEPDPPPGLEQP